MIRLCVHVACEDVHIILCIEYFNIQKVLKMWWRHTHEMLERERNTKSNWYYYKVNSFLAESNVLFDESFILHKFMHLCMIRFDVRTSMAKEGEE
jgi:hypothetical protein